MKYRLKYQKLDTLRFISHLDIQKVFQRAFRRADIKLIYSSGFNPHPKIHFAPPLPIFSESYGEYMEFETSVTYSVDYLHELLVSILPKNLNILCVTEVNENDKNLSKSLDYAIYKIEFSLNNENKDILNETAKELNNIMNINKSLLVKKKNKKGKIKDIDIKPMLYFFKAEASDTYLIVTANLSLKADGILSPNLLIRYIERNIKDFQINFTQQGIIKLDSILI